MIKIIFNILTLLLYSTEVYYYLTDIVYREFFPMEKDTVHFKVRAASVVYFGFMSQPKNAKPWIDIDLGGWSNEWQSIALNRNFEVYANIDNIINEWEFRGFWARKDGDCVSAGFEGQTSPFITWNSTKEFNATHFSIASKSTGKWKVEGYSWMDDDVLLNMVQNTGKELLNPTGLVLKKTRSSIDNRSTVYCAKHRISDDGKWTQGVESKFISLATQTEDIPSGELSVKVGPETRMVFDENSQLKFTCSGSAPVDGRILRWFRKDRSYRDPISLENQNYDPTTNTNDLELTLDESYDKNLLFCAQGYQYSIQHNGTTIIKNYGDSVRSEDIVLVMKRECSAGQRVSMWPGMAMVAVVSTYVTA